MDEYDPLWLGFLQSLNTVDSNNTQQNITQSTVLFDSLFTEDDDDEEFIGPDDEQNIETTDEKKLRVSSIFKSKFSLATIKTSFFFQDVN